MMRYEQQYSGDTKCFRYKQQSAERKIELVIVEGDGNYDENRQLSMTENTLKEIVPKKRCVSIGVKAMY